LSRPEARQQKGNLGSVPKLPFTGGKGRVARLAYAVLGGGGYQRMKGQKAHLRTKSLQGGRTVRESIIPVPGGEEKKKTGATYRNKKLVF